MEFTLTNTIKTTAKEIYNAWISTEGHTQMTGGKATNNGKTGGDFTAWDGYIYGKNISLEPNTRIVQSWRTAQFEKNEEDSQIEILLKEQNGETEITLHHTKVPESGDHYIKGWSEHYFTPMKIYFEGKK